MSIWHLDSTRATPSYPMRAVRAAAQQMKVYCIKKMVYNHYYFSVRILNMPAASLIAKLSDMSHYLSEPILAILNTFFKNDEDQLFKKIVVEEFLFRYREPQLL